MKNNEAIKHLENMKWLKGYDNTMIGDKPLTDIIDGIITLLKEQDAEAKWIYGEDETGVDGWHCSECGFFEPWFYEFTNDIDFIRFYAFCPRCGRKMTSYTGKSVQERR